MIISFKNINGGGGGGGTTNYSALENKPQINGVTLEGNKTTEQLGIVVNGKMLEPVEELPTTAETGTVMALHKAEKRFVDYSGSFMNATANTVTFKAYSDTAHTSTLDICQARIPSQISPETTLADLKVGDGGWSALTPSDYVDWTTIEMQGLGCDAYFKVDFANATVYVRLEEGYFDTVEGLSEYTQEAYTEPSAMGIYQYDGTEWAEVGSGEGQGIEIVTELPSSGYDGQTVLLIENIPEKIITTVWNNENVTATTIGVMQKTQIFNYEWYGMRIYVYAMPDGSIQIFNDYNSQTETVDVGNGFVFMMPNGNNNNLYFNVYESGFTVTADRNIARENIIQDILQHAEEKEVLYTWSDNEALTADIDYTAATGYPWCVRFKYSELPEGTLVVWKYHYGEDYRHLVYENSQLHIYTSNSADTYTATTFVNVAQYAIVDGGRSVNVYWTDDEVIVFAYSSADRISINIDAFYRNGWHKELEHKVSNKSYYKTPFYYDGDNGVIIQIKEFYERAIRLNPNYDSGSGGDSYNVWSRDNRDSAIFYAPTTRGTADQICVSAGGSNGQNSRPTWKNFTDFTNGVKFWKGSQDDYDALATKDADTLYIIIPD